MTVEKLFELSEEEGHQAKRLAEEYKIGNTNDMSDFTGPDLHDRAGAIQNLFKYSFLASGELGKTPEQLARERFLISRWVVKSFPQAIQNWRESIVRYVEEGKKNPKFYASMLTNAVPGEDPLYKSDPGFYKELRDFLLSQGCDFVWEK